MKSCHKASYIGDKLNLDHWEDLLKNYEDFREEFICIFNKGNILEADKFTLETLDDTYLRIEVILPRDSDSSELARVVKCLRDKTGILVGTAKNNLILDSRIYEIKYLDGHRASLAVSTITVNLFAQVDDEGFQIQLLDEIANHQVNGEEIKQNNAFIIFTNGG